MNIVSVPVKLGVSTVEKSFASYLLEEIFCANMLLKQLGKTKLNTWPMN